MCDDPSCRDPRCGLRPVSRVSTMPTPSGRRPSGPCSDSGCNDPHCLAAITRRSTEPLALTSQGGLAVYPNFPPPTNSRGWEDNEYSSGNGGYRRRDSIYSSYINPIYGQLLPLRVFKHVPATLTLSVIRTRQKYMILL